MKIPRKLPNLDLSEDSTRDFCKGASESNLQSYLEFYGFDKLELHGSRHYFGGLDLAGYRIATHVWRQPNAINNILVVPGLFDHVGLYLSVVQVLLINNYSVVAMDLPGHGLSSGPVAAINSFDEYGLLINECLTRLNDDLPKPWYALGQSTGCSALMNYMFLVQDKIAQEKITHNKKQLITFEKVVLLAPLVRPTHYRVVWFAYLLLSPFLKRVKRSFKRNSHDQDFLTFLDKKDPLQARIISVPWVAAMIEWANTFPQKPVIDTPILIVQGTKDTTVDFNYNVPKMKLKFTHCECRYVKNAMHHLARESDEYRQKVLDFTLAFFKEIKKGA